MLQKAQRAEIVAVMENGRLLRSLHDRLAPDLVFLDVHRPV
jgi:hypothetical protein